MGPELGFSLRVGATARCCLIALAVTLLSASTAQGQNVFVLPIEPTTRMSVFDCDPFASASVCQPYAGVVGSFQFLDVTRGFTFDAGTFSLSPNHTEFDALGRPRAIFPGDTIAWQATGQFFFSSSTLTPAPVFAFAPGTTITPDTLPPGTAPWINLGTFSGPNLPEEFTGPLVGFDGAAQVGTWEVIVRPAPEPATLALLGIGLAGLGFSRRKRKQ